MKAFEKNSDMLYESYASSFAQKYKSAATDEAKLEVDERARGMLEHRRHVVLYNTLKFKK